VPVYLGAAIAVLRASRGRRSDPHAPVVLALAVISTLLMIGVALMTEGGFAGNLRYVALPAAMVCILAGAGWVGLARSAHARWGRGIAVAVAVAVAALFAPFAVADVRDLETGRELFVREADLYGANLEAMIAKAGGEDAIKSCGIVITGPFQTQAVAWYLHLHETDLSIFTMPPGTVIAPHYLAMARDPRFEQVTKTSRWNVSSSCARR
jgi:hypothetical protein